MQERRKRSQPLELPSAGSVFKRPVGYFAGKLIVAAGLQGPAVIATDAGISLVLGAVKTLVFQSSGVLPLSSWIMALVIGVAALPGAFIAKRLAHRLSLKAHTNILDVVVMLGGALLVLQGITGS